MNELAKEVEDIEQLSKKGEVVNQTRIKSKTASLINKVLMVLPEAQKNIATLAPLTPLIGESVERLVTEYNLILRSSNSKNRLRLIKSKKLND